MLTRLLTGRSKAEWRALYARAQLLDAGFQKLRTELSTTRAAIDKTSGAALAVKLNEVESGLVTLQQANRREFGRLWKLLGNEGIAGNGKSAVVDEQPDDELAAFLALQSNSKPPL
jgi:hypothetical protein